MKPASVCEQPIVGQSQSCVPCLSPCSGHTGALWCSGQSFIPACSEPASHENAVATAAITTTCHARAIAATKRARLRTNCMTGIISYCASQVSRCCDGAPGTGLNCQPCRGSTARTTSILRAVPLRVIVSVTFAPGENRASRSAKRPSGTGSPLIAAISSSNDMPASAAGDPRRMPVTMVLPFSVRVATPRYGRGVPAGGVIRRPNQAKASA